MEVPPGNEYLRHLFLVQSLRDELHVRVNNWLENAVLEQHVIEEHILKSDYLNVQKALSKYIFDTFNFRGNQMGNKNIP